MINLFKGVVMTEWDDEDWDDEEDYGEEEGNWEDTEEEW